MIDKLESSADNLTKSNLLENIEGKILDLQSQLRSVKEQRETGVVPQPVAVSVYGGRGRGRGRGVGSGPGSGFSGYYPQYGGRAEYSTGEGGGRGRGSGRGFYGDDESSGGRDSGGRGSGRGRGRFSGRGVDPGSSGRGHPGHPGHPGSGYTTIDNRTKNLVIYQPPDGFQASAQEHFSR